MIGDEVHWHAKGADPEVQDGSLNGDDLLVGEGHELDILVKGVCDTQDELLSIGQYFEGPK